TRRQRRVIGRDHAEGLRLEIDPVLPVEALVLDDVHHHRGERWKAQARELDLDRLLAPRRFRQHDGQHDDDQASGHQERADHGPAFLRSTHERFSLMRRWTRSGGSGRSRTSRPSGASASATALAMAAVEPMVPPSAIPLKPVTLVAGGVSMWMMSIGGTSIVPGIT